MIRATKGSIWCWPVIPMADRCAFHFMEPSCCRTAWTNMTLACFKPESGPLYVNPGIGWYYFDVRFNCRPEITVIEI